MCVCVYGMVVGEMHFHSVVSASQNLGFEFAVCKGGGGGGQRQAK